MSRVAVWGCVVASVFFGGRAQACNGDAFSLQWGNASEVQMRVKENENCRFGLKIGGASHLESMVVSQAPQHGTIKQIDRSHFTYHPSSNYTGPDVLQSHGNWAT